MKTIKLSDDTYDTLMDVLADVLFAHVMPGDSASANILYGTIKVNTDQYDSGDEEAISDVEKRIIERRVQEFIESLDGRKRDALLYFLDPVGWSTESQNYALHCLLRALLDDANGLGAVDDSQENDPYERI